MKKIKKVKHGSKIKLNELLADFLKKHNLVIFITVISAGLVAVILVISNILIQPEQFQSANSATTNVGSFDQATINKLNTLNPSDNNSQSLPSGRINPFAE